MIRRNDAVMANFRMTQHLPSLPAADLTRLRPMDPRDVVLSFLGAELAATSKTVARRLSPWGIKGNSHPLLRALAETGLAEAAGRRWLITEAGKAEAARRFDLAAHPTWRAFADYHFVAAALGLDPALADTRVYLADARNLYACTLAVLFDLADPATHPKLSAMRAALVWRVAAARCPDLLTSEGPKTMTGRHDALTRALYLGFCGLTRGTVDQATPTLLRRVLPGAAAGVNGIRRALASAALNTKPVDDFETAPSEADSAQPASPRADKPQDFAATVRALAQTLRTPKPNGGHFTGGQVAIAQVYDAYTANGGGPMTLDDFKARLWAAVRAGADFHLTRLDIPDLMDDELRNRSATPTRAGDVVHFIVAE